MQLKALLLALLPLAAQAETLPSDSAIFRQANIDQVVVTGVRSETDPRHTPFTVTQISRQQVEERQSPSLLDVAAEQTPGLFITGRGMLGYGVSTGAAGQMNVRGIGSAPTTGMMVLVDGHPQVMGIMGHPIADAYQSFLVEKVEVLRGPASMLYGSNAMGGVINIVTRKMQADGMTNDLHLSGGSYGTFTSDFTNRLRRGRFFSIASLSYNRSDNQRRNLGFEQMGGYAKVGYDFSANWTAYADLSLTHFNASNPGTVYAPVHDNDQHITRGIASAVVLNNYGWTSGGISAFLNWGRHKIDDGYSDGAAPKDYLFRSNDHVSGFNAYQTFSLFAGNRTTVGFDLQSIGGKAWNEYADHDAQLVDTAMTEVAGYVDFRQDIVQWLTLEAGLRLDHHSVAGTEWVPQFGAAFRLPHQMQLKLTAGKGFRNPTLMNLFMFRPKNPDLEAERIWNYEAAFSHVLLDGRLRYGLNIYCLKGDNLIQTVQMHNQNTGEVENWGVELSGNYRISRHWQANANYAFVHAKHDIVALPKHNLYAEVRYACGPWTATLGGQWVNHLVTQAGSASAERQLQSYFLLNARGSYRLNRHLALQLRGDNLLAQRYEINYGYPMPKATFMAGVHVSF